MNETTQQEKTTQFSSRNEQLNSAAGTKQFNSSVGTKQLNSALPSTAYNRLQPPTTAYNRLQPPTTACNRLHRLYSRIGFFYLLMSNNHRVCLDEGMREDRHLTIIARRNRSAAVSQLSRKLYAGTETLVSRVTVSRRLYDKEGCLQENLLFVSRQLGEQ
ncbi:hypothetical protein TNCV_4896481 [Trichonephila clavipes]|uniref:Uncharacterized protein n=1 Tax=Trichonephila clavipes TaxID=2585209 RepID=A0A8X6VWZ5_TRICX|nr:hypothetical protein TNCV_4896481 [Trichonephila clavipes]